MRLAGCISCGLLVLFPLPLMATCVVLLHGLARTDASMSVLEQALSEAGYRVVNVDYPSRHHSIEELISVSVDQGMQRCSASSTVHFVTHSLGGVLVRYRFRDELPPNLGRVVMLAPPNQGSEVVDVFGQLPGFSLLNGPAGDQLGTDTESVPRSLGPVQFETGVIAGTRSINLILSLALPNPDDGKVSVESTRVAGMKDFIMLPHSHALIMRTPATVHQVLHFLAKGEFDHSQVQ